MMMLQMFQPLIKLRDEQQSVPPENLIAEFDFNNRVENTIGTKEIWSVTNGKYEFIEELNQWAFDFDGGNGYAEAPDSDLYSFADVSGDKPFSVSMYMYAPSNNVDGTLFGKGDNDDLYEYFTYVVGSGVGIATFDAVLNKYKYSYSLGNPITYNVWHHVVFTIYEKNFKMYVNGIEHTNNYVQDRGINQMSRLNYKARIGRTSDNSVGKRFNGKILGLAVWDKALSPDEISRLYTLQLDGKSILDNFIQDDPFDP